LVDAFIKNFHATYERSVGIEELRYCQQKPNESICEYIRGFTKLPNDVEDVSVDRAIDAFSDGIRRESYIEELGRKKPKTITKLMEIANSWVDGEDHVRKPRPRSDDEDDDQRHDSGHRRDCRKKRKDRGYDDTNIVAAGHSDRRDDRYDDQRGDRRDDRRDNNRNSSGGNRGNYRERTPRVPELLFAEELNAHCYIHAYIGPKDNTKKLSHFLRDYRQFIDIQKFYETGRAATTPKLATATSASSSASSNLCF
jgi:hypothetical protein